MKFLLEKPKLPKNKTVSACSTIRILYKRGKTYGFYLLWVQSVYNQSAKILLLMKSSCKYPFHVALIFFRVVFKNFRVIFILFRILWGFKTNLCGHLGKIKNFFSS